MSAPQIPPPGSAAPSTASGAAGLVSLPSEIIRLPQELAARLLTGLRTVFISGTVTGQGADGALQIRSQFGEIAVKAGTTVPPDRQISLQIPPLTDKTATLTASQLSRSPIPATLLLSKSAALPAGPASPASSQQAAGPLAEGRVPASPVPASAAPSPSTPATLQTPTSAAPIATTAPSLQGSDGARLTPAVSTPVPSAAASTPQAGSPAAPNLTGRPVSGVPTTQPAPGSSPAPSPAQAPAAPPLGRLTLAAQLLTQSSERPAKATPIPQARAAAPQAQSATLQTSTAPTAGPASSPSTHPAAATADGARIAALVARDPLAPPVIERDGIPSGSVQRVPALRDAVSALGAADPMLAARFVKSVLPQANSQLAATLLFFLAATRSGDIRGWMGSRVTSTLDEAGRGDLLPKLSAELGAPARPMPDSAGDWRSQTVPFYLESGIGGMAVHVRRTGDEDGAAADGEAGGHRFLIDMDLTRMGPLQFDGLVRDKRFDLIIRTQAAFPEPMRQDMRVLFRDASDTVGLHGGLTFQTGRHDWATVAETRGG